MKYLPIAGLSVFLLILITLFSGDEEKQKPDFHDEAMVIQSMYKPSFATRKIKHILIYTWGLCDEYNLDYNVVKSMIAIESHWNGRAVSSANCVGLMQIGKMAAEQLNSSKADLEDPYVNITLGVLYLDWLDERYDGDQEKVLRAYHEGPGNVDKSWFSFGKGKYVTNVLALAGQ